MSKINTHCCYCGIIFKTKQSQYDRKIRHFCSRNCYSEFRKYIMPPHQQPSYKNGGMGEKERQKRVKCRSDANHAIRNGTIKRQSCKVCGKNAQMHHNNYSKPLIVKWFCFYHHRKLHGQFSA